VCATNTESGVSVRNGCGSGPLAVLVLGPVLVLGGAVAARAQSDAPQYEVFGGYAYLRDVTDEAVSIPKGWNASIARNLGRSLGLVVDLGGHYKSEEGGDFSEHTILGGSRYSFRGDKLTPYVEALVGGVRSSESFGGESESTWDLAVQAGAGLGFKISDNVSLRTGVDFRNIFREEQSSQELRVVAGVSFGLGGRREPAASSGMQRPLPEPVSPRRTVPGPDLGAQPASPLPPPRPAAPARTPLDQEPTRPPETLGVRPPAATLESGALSRGRDLLRRGSYPQASDAFREHLRLNAADRFTIAVGLYCDPTNVAQLVHASGSDEQLFLLRARRRGAACYGIYWGVFGSSQEAQQNLASLPPALRAAGPAPVPVLRLLR